MKRRLRLRTLDWSFSGNVCLELTEGSSPLSPQHPSRTANRRTRWVWYLQPPATFDDGRFGSLSISPWPLDEEGVVLHWVWGAVYHQSGSSYWTAAFCIVSSSQTCIRCNQKVRRSNEAALVAERQQDLDGHPHRDWPANCLCPSTKVVMGSDSVRAGFAMY